MPARVKSYMSENPVTVDPQTSLLEAIEMMRRFDFRHLPVVADDQLLGIISDRDIRLHMTATMGHGLATTAESAMLDQVSVEEHMSRGPITVTPDTPLADAVELIVEEKVGALPVVEPEGSATLVGIITTMDMLAHLHELLQGN